MTDYVWPLSIIPNGMEWREISNSESSPGLFSGIAQTTVRPGDRKGCTVYVRNAKGTNRAIMRAFAAKLRGFGNRVMIPDYSAKRRGSFSTGEGFSNADFSNSTTGWSVLSGATIAAADGVVKLAVTTPGGNVGFYQSVTLTQFAPYALRSLSIDGDQTVGLSLGPHLNILSGVASVSGGSTTHGYNVVSGVSLNSGADNQYSCYFVSSTGYLAGTFALVPYASIARCILADGGPNLLTQSKALNHADWTKAASVSVGADAAVGADGIVDADEFDESGSGSQEWSFYQSKTVSAAAADYAYKVRLKGVGRSWVALRLFETTGSQAALAYFNISAGTLGTVTSSTNFSLARAVIIALGNGWFECCLIGRKTNAATTIRGIVNSTTGNGASLTVTGLLANAFYYGGGSLGATSSIDRIRTTTTAAITGEAQTDAGIYVKGLPASTSGLLKTGDAVEILKQIKFLAADLDSDAAGRGRLILDSPCARGVPDNTPIIVHNPMSRCFMTNAVEYPNEPGDFSSFQFDFEEDLST
jgi:hypothetical protein